MRAEGRRRFRADGLAAIDMYGSAGARWRRWVILIEFWLGAALAGLLAAAELPRGGAWNALIAIWLIGACANYLTLAVFASLLIRDGALERAVAGLDVPAELRYYGVAQLWVAVPFAVAGLAVLRAGRRR